VINMWAREGNVERLQETAQALVKRAEPSVPEWAARSVFDRIGRALTLTPGPDFATAVCEVARLADAEKLASLTAYGQQVDVCATLFAASDEADEEFLACLLQELVLRHENLEREPFASFWRMIKTRGHPLGLLPLRITSVEVSITLWLPSYTWPGQVFHPAGTRRDDGASDEPDAAQVGSLGRETTAPADRERLRSAVATWLDESNGRAETRVFDLRVDQSPRSLADVLADTGLECLGGRSPTRVDAISPSHAFDALFPAASTGGAYDHGRYGAYGRLNTWQTMSALVGAHTDEPIEQVAELEA